jgi:hypothetical protein
MIIRKFGIIELFPDGTNAMIDNDWNNTQDDAQALRFNTKQEASDFSLQLQGVYQVKQFLEEQ